MPVCLKGARTGESCRGRTSSVIRRERYSDRKMCTRAGKQNGDLNGRPLASKITEPE